MEQIGLQVSHIVESGLCVEDVSGLEQEFSKLQGEYLRNPKHTQTKTSEPSLVKLRLWLHRIITQSYRSDLVHAASQFCRRNPTLLGLEEKPRSIFFPVEYIPRPSELLKILRGNFNMHNFMKPIPENIEQILGDIPDSKGFVPHLETLLMHFPTYLKHYLNLSQYLLESTLSPIHEVQAYFLAVMGASVYGCMYLFQRLVKRFLEVGGDPQWLEGKLPVNLQSIKRLNCKLAYSPWSITKQDVKPLFTFYSLKHIVFIVIILSLHHSLACLCMANGITTQQPLEKTSKVVNIEALKQYPLWQDGKACNSKKQEKSKVFSLAELAEELQNQPKRFVPEPTLPLACQNRNSDYEISSQYMKTIDKQMKSLNLYSKISNSFAAFLDQSQKVQRFDFNLYASTDCSMLGFKPGVFVFLQDIDEQLASYVSNLIDYTKDMTNQLIGDKKECSTMSLRQAIRFYYENLCGYRHLHYNYKEKMTKYLSKQLKFYVKVAAIYPFLMEQSVLRNIPHEDCLLSFFDLVHISLLTTNTKFELSLTMASRILRQLSS